MNIDPKTINKHQDHEVMVQLSTTGPHAAQLRCRECDKWIKWLTIEQATEISDMIGDIE